MPPFCLPNKFMNAIKSILKNEVKSLYFICKCLLAQIHVYHLCAWGPQRPEGVIDQVDSLELVYREL